MYSFRPSMRVLNGELQTLVGLADYARIADSRRARRVVSFTARRMVRALDAWDTGAWTLYSAGGREASLHYHRLAATFARRACEQRLARGFCPASKRFARYSVEPPRLSIRVASRVTAPRRVRVRVRASKLARGALVVRGPRGFRRRVALSSGAGPRRCASPRGGRDGSACPLRHRGEREDRRRRARSCASGPIPRSSAGARRGAERPAAGPRGSDGSGRSAGSARSAANAPTGPRRSL